MTLPDGRRMAHETARLHIVEGGGQLPRGKIDEMIEGLAPAPG
jgi:hypothetical protein